jgi:hypothetical protein
VREHHALLKRPGAQGWDGWIYSFVLFLFWRTATNQALQLTMCHIAATLAIVGALLVSAGSAWADFDDGMAALKRGDYAAGFQEFKFLAEQGDPHAQTNIAAMYAAGKGVPQNHPEAVIWYRKAAQNGHAEGQFGLGVMYHQGWGVPENYVQAVKWYRKASEKGHAKAQVNLGSMYNEGRGVQQNNAEAVKLFRKAANQGDAGAQYILGIMYFDGKGVATNYIRSYMWWSVAKSQGHKDAAYNINIIEEQMTPAQIAIAQELASQWWDQHSN